MGIIEEIIKGKDQQIRGAKVRKMARGKPEFLIDLFRNLYF